jgi:hypothetical protein
MEIQKIGQLPFLEKQRRRQIDKELILKFFKHERYVFFSCIQSLLSCSRSSAQRKLASLVKSGILKTDSLPISNELYGQKTMKIYSFTSGGIEYARGLFDDENFLLFDKSRLSMNSMKHSYVIQQIKARYMKKGLTVTYPIFSIKIADSYIDDLNICVEVEINIKSYARYNEIIGEYIYLISQNSPTINEIHYILPDGVYKNRLIKIFRSFSTVAVKEQTLMLDSSIFNIFKFYTIDEYYDYINNLDKIC